MKFKKTRVLALALIAALITSFYVPVTSFADLLSGSINSQIGPVVVGTHINKDFTINLGAGDIGWSWTFNGVNQGMTPITVNGLTISDNLNSFTHDYTAHISGTPTEAGIIYLEFANTMSGVPVATWTLTISPAGETVKEPEVVTYIPPCEHTYEWRVEKTATADEDGEEILVCTKCGAVKEKMSLSAMGAFDEETANKILKSGPGAIVNINTTHWNSLGRAVKEAMIKRPDVTLKTSFLSEGHKGTELKVTIPAGRSDLFDSNGYLGLCRAGVELGFDN